MLLTDTATGKYDDKIPISALLVESMEGIIPRTSLLDLDVLVSQHPAPDNLGFTIFIIPAYCFERSGL